MSSEEAVPKNVNDGEESPCKRLRYSDHDVKIILKYKAMDDKKQQVIKEYPMYGQVLSSLSPFIDTCLSADMKENRTKEIVLDDIAPELFELALKFQTDHIAIRAMKPPDAMAVVQFYHKYDFRGGVELCDQVLAEFFNEAATRKSPPSGLGSLVDAVVLVDELELKKAQKSSIRLIKRGLESHEISKFGLHVTMFSVEHIKRLHPLFIKGLFSVSLPPDTTQEELESPLFPKYFVNYHCRLYETPIPSKVEVSAAGKKRYEYMAIYERYFDEYKFQSLSHNDGYCTYAIRKGTPDGQGAEQDQDWIITRGPPNGEPGRVIWRSPYSQNLAVPPVEPWIYCGVGTRLPIVLEYDYDYE